MAQINDFLSHIDFEAMHEYCIANGKTVSYVKACHLLTNVNSLDLFHRHRIGEYG